MPFNRAIEFLKLEYHDYLAYLKDCQHAKSLPQQLDDSLNDDNDTYYDDNQSSSSFSPPPIHRRKSLFDLVMTKFIAERDRLTLTDLDFMLTFLSRQKREMLVNSDQINSRPGSRTSMMIPSLIQSSPPLQPQTQTQTQPLMSLMNSSTKPSLMSLHTNNNSNNNNFNNFNNRKF